MSSNNKYCSIYKITNVINNKVYIGQTWKTIQRRFEIHCYDSPSRKSLRSKIKNAILKHGKHNFTIELLAIVYEQEIANILETYFIEEFNTINNGYNIHPGGSSGRLSAETKKLISRRKIGSKHSVETRRRMSEAQKKKWATDQYRQLVRPPNSTPKLTEKQFLKLLQEQHLYSRRQLAKKYGVSKATIIRYLSGNVYSLPVDHQFIKRSCRLHAKLTWSEVIEIRTLYSAGYSLSNLATKFRIGKTTVHQICSGKTWKLK